MNTVYHVIQGDFKANPEYGFLHIPKCGGTSVVDFVYKINDATVKRPLLFFHSWDMQLILRYFPNIKISFSIRDPLERVVSGFQSRLRQGRPRYNQPWRVYEATAFSLFNSAETFLDSLLKEDDYSVAATEFALNHILAISWNYQFYFHDAESVRLYRKNICLVGQTSGMSLYINQLCNKAFQFNEHSNLDDIVRSYDAAHQSQLPSRNILAKYSEEEIGVMRDRLAIEYEIYGALSEMIER